MMKRRFIFPILLFVLLLSACTTTEASDSNEMDGIELAVKINDIEFSSEDPFVVIVTVTNNNDFEKKVYVPTSSEIEEGISAVMVEKKDETLYQFLNPANNDPVENIKERTFYEFVPVELGANETIEQEFQWTKELTNQESREIIEASSGEYILSSFIVLDELNEEEDYYEPENQLISKLKFTVK